MSDQKPDAPSPALSKASHRAAFAAGKSQSSAYNNLSIDGVLQQRFEAL